MGAVAVLVGLALSAPPGEKDLAAACRLAKAAVQRAPATYQEPRRSEWYENRWARWYAEIEAAASDREFRSILSASGQVSHGDRYGLFVAHARSAGLAHWSCPELERVLGSPDEDFSALCEEVRREGSGILERWQYNSAAAKAALAAARAKPGTPALAAMKKTAEWPEETFNDCAELEAVVVQGGDLPNEAERKAIEREAFRRRAGAAVCSSL